MNVLYETGQRIPIKIWSPIDEVETQALNQLKNIAAMPFVFKHVAAMPDVHLGVGATVGSVIATKGAIMPTAVGVDIGCGMMAAQLNVRLEDVRENIKEIRSVIEGVIPVGHLGNATIGNDALVWDGWDGFAKLNALGRMKVEANQQKAVAQMGSLGGGNHFIELCESTQGNCWLMLHSGSRGIGNQVARVHIDHAKAEMKRMFVTLPDPDLAYFVQKTPEYDAYISDLMWCQDYAAWNRHVMFIRILKEIHRVLNLPDSQIMVPGKIVNCHHNYAERENHYGENVIVTRKGAVRARLGDLGIIPGSMGTRSYIVEGLGSAESFHSCSHGAGRKMSRNAARKQFNLADLEAQTAGVECRKDDGVLDEIPGAYKDIDQVMENQKDLVKVVAQLKQFMCIKG